MMKHFAKTRIVRLWMVVYKILAYGSAGSVIRVTLPAFASAFPRFNSFNNLRIRKISVGVTDFSCGNDFISFGSTALNDDAFIIGHIQIFAKVFT